MMITRSNSSWWRDCLTVGCLCRTLPLSGPEWVNKLVVITEVVDVRDDGQTMYKVVDSEGNVGALPYYSMEMIVDPKE